MKKQFTQLLVLVSLFFVSANFVEADFYKDLGSELNKNFDELVNSAHRGDANAQCALGYRYHDGAGAPQDFKEAIKWYAKAAEQGHIYAQLLLGNMYYVGKEIPLNYEKSAKWYIKAAEQGNVTAQITVGKMYYLGNGVAKDYVQAHMWFNLAAAGGDEQAKKNRDILALEMTLPQKEEAQKLATKWKQKK
jgi:TPR repeat protein